MRKENGCEDHGCRKSSNKVTVKILCYDYGAAGMSGREYYFNRSLALMRTSPRA